MCPLPLPPRRMRAGGGGSERCPAHFRGLWYFFLSFFLEMGYHKLKFLDRGRPRIVLTQQIIFTWSLWIVLCIVIFHLIVINVNMNIAVKGVLTWENSHRREFHTRMTFWFRIAFTWWRGHFIFRHLKVHLKVLMLIKYTCDSKSQTLRLRYPFQVYRQTDFTPERLVVSRLHDTVARFRTWVKFSPRYKNRAELTPGWLAPAWHFVAVSCKQI